MKNLKIKNFSKTNLCLEKPFLLQVMVDAWNQFWQKDLKDLLNEVSPIKDYTGTEKELWFTNYKLGEPKYKNDFEAKKNNDSYSAPLKVKAKLVNLRTKKFKEQEVFLCDFPLLTPRGTFIINGVERVAISQLIRSSGVLFTSKQFGGQDFYGAKIIPNRGAWLEFEIETNNIITVKINRKKKVYATTLLKAFGLTDEKSIIEKFQDVNKGTIDYIQETLKKDPCKNQIDAITEIYQKLKPGERINIDTAREFIFNMFFDFNHYDLSRVGRWRMNERIPETKTKERKGEDITPEERVLSLKDIIAVIREIIRLNNDPNSKPDQIDHLGNRRVRTFNELLINRMRVGMLRLTRIVKDKIALAGEEGDSFLPNHFINPKPIMGVINEFFGTSQISQFMDSENPLAGLEHKRRFTASGPGGLSKERAGFEVRDVQLSHYGRICPIETPEGASTGLNNHLTVYGRINSYGFLETPYFKVEKGKVLSKVEYLNAFKEEKHTIASANTLIDDQGRLKDEVIEARIKGEAGTAYKEEIDYIDVSPEQCLSTAASLIPFLQNTDASRALMGANMQRQAVPLINPEPALVMTGMEEKVAKECGEVIVSEIDGVVDEVDGQHIKIKPSDKSEKSREYFLKIFSRTNQYTCFHQKPIVKKGEKVKKGQVLTDGGAISQGYLSLGRNILVGILPWRGWNYEDAIVVSENLIRNDAFSSIHIRNFVCDVRETRLGPEVTTNDIPNVSEQKLKDLDLDGIVRIGAEVEPGDILVGKISPKGELELTPEEKLLRAIFGEKAKDVKDTSLRMEHGQKGRVVNIKIFSREDGYKLDPGTIKRIEVEVAELRKIQAGDKLSGRYGNKGIISRIVPIEDMPYLEDGTPIDIIINPLSVPSRMNLGQILETHLGLAANKLKYYAITPSLSGATEEDIKKELKSAGLPEDGKLPLYDGMTGSLFREKICVGYMYIIKLIHMVADKVYARSIGPYSLITQQPLQGKAQMGGQRFGEMEVWALEGFGASHTLQEILTIKSDDVMGRASTYESIIKGEEIKEPNIPSSFALLVNELKSLSLNLEIKTKERIKKNFYEKE